MYYSYTLPGAKNSCLCLTLTSRRSHGSEQPCAHQEPLQTSGGVTKAVGGTQVEIAVRTRGHAPRCPGKLS